jgi:hypothetical protein
MPEGLFQAQEKIRHIEVPLKVIGLAVTRAVSRRLSTAADRVRARVKSCGICGGRSFTEGGFLRVLRFPLSTIHYIDWSTIIIGTEPATIKPVAQCLNQLRYRSGTMQNRAIYDHEVLSN